MISDTVEDLIETVELHTKMLTELSAELLRLSTILSKVEVIVEDKKEASRIII